jgi:hypothetical protein
MDVVSRRWLSTLVSAEETSCQIQAGFLAALDEEQLADRIDARLLARLRAGELSPAEIDGPEADRIPVLIAMSDNGPQMRSHSTKEFMAAGAIMQRFGRPGTPTESSLDRVAVRPRQDRLAAAGEDPRPRRTRRRTRPRPSRVQHRAPARRHRLPHPQRRTPRPRRGDPPSPPQRPGQSTPDTHHIPSNQHEEPIMIARRPWLGISLANDRIKSSLKERGGVNLGCDRFLLIPG